MVNFKSIILVSVLILLTGCTTVKKTNSNDKKLLPPNIKLADPDACDNAKKIMGYFRDEVYGKHILSGVMDCAWSNQIDMDYKVFSDTGKHTALMGFDFMDMTKADAKGWYNPNQVRKAIDWWNNGGLVTFCWHWRDPSKQTSKGAEFYTEKTDFRIPYDEENDCLDESSPNFQAIKKDLDTISLYLFELDCNDVVVLFRPLHEGAGNWGKYAGLGKAWFWWGDSGPKPYIALYRYMFNYFTKEKNLHNLIWIWNGQHKEYYPGDDYVDIIGWDPYQKNHSALTNYHDSCLSMSDNPIDSPKFIAITENDCVPYAEALKKAASNWLFFMIWNDNDSLLDDSKTDNDNFWGGQTFNSLEDKTVKCFDSPYVITLDTLHLNEILK